MSEAVFFVFYTKLIYNKLCDVTLFSCFVTNIIYEGDSYMKKDLMFLVSMIVVSVLLFLLRFTGLIPHIIISVIGLLLMIALTIKNTENWKIPALEIVMRVLYFVAIVSGGLIMKIHNLPALSIVHKVCAVLFVILLLVLYIPKLIKK